MRNLAEKMRRDKLNMYIAELSTLVPIVAMATKRMDKTSVLRLSANFLRIHLSTLIMHLCDVNKYKWNKSNSRVYN